MQQQEDGRNGLNRSGSDRSGLERLGVNRSSGWVEAGIHIMSARPNLLPLQRAAFAQTGARAERDALVDDDLIARANGPDGLAMLTHDIRNMVAALELYCDLLAEPGVLAASFTHYSGELRLVAAASRQLIEKIATLERRERTSAASALTVATGRAPKSRPGSALPFRPNRLRGMGDARSTRLSRPPHFGGPGRDTSGADAVSQSRRFFAPTEPVDNLAEELLASQNLLAAMAGPGITLGLTLPTTAEKMAANRSRSGASTGHAPAPDLALEMTRDDLTRILINLVRNAADAMPQGGHIQIALALVPGRLSLTVTDTGPGIPNGLLTTIFAAGYSTRISLDPGTANACAWPGETGEHRGLGLAIVRAIVVAAGGRVWAENCAAQNASPSGACIHVDFALLNPGSGES